MSLSRTVGLNPSGSIGVFHLKLLGRVSRSWFMAAETAGFISIVLGALEHGAQAGSVALDLPVELGAT